MVMMKKVFACISLFCIFFACCPDFSQGASVASLTFQSDRTRYIVDSEFEVKLHIQNVERLFGYSIEISFNHRFMDLIKIEEGDFFSSRDLEVAFQQKADTGKGTIKLASAILGRSQYASGEGALVNLKFKAKHEGNAQIMFDQVTLKDDQLHEIDATTENIELSFFYEQELPILQVSPTLLDFGSIEFGTQPEKILSVTNAGEGELRGDVSSANPWLRIRPQSFQGDTDFTVAILSHTLPPNASYSGEISIRSNGGNETVRVTFHSTRDEKRDPPSLYILTPDDNMLTRHARLFILCETDPGAFASINDQRIHVDAKDGIFFFNTTLREGVNTYNISVWDAYDNRRTETITVTLRTIPPELNVSEVPMFTHDEEIQIQGDTDPEASLYFNRQPVQLARDGSFSVSYTVRGEVNQLVFTAVDDLGNSRTVVRVFFYRSVYPNTITLVVGNNTGNFNGRDFPIDAPPILLDGRVMVPIRIIAEIFGAEIDWRPHTKTVIITLRYEEIRLSVGSTEAVVNGRPTPLDVAPVIHNGRLMVPIRFISEIFRSVVEWDQELRRVTIRF